MYNTRDRQEPSVLSQLQKATWRKPKKTKEKKRKKEKQHENRWAPVQQQTMDPNPPQDMETGHDQQVLAIKHKSSILD